MATKRHVRLFRNGRNQAIRIPREFELPGSDALLFREGDRLVIEPLRKKSLLEVVKSLEPTDEELPEIVDRPPEPVDVD